MLIEDEAIDAIDRFALVYHLSNGHTVLDQFLAGWPDLSAADREMLRGRRGPVDGIFEIRGRDRDSLMLLNVVDDLEYHTYSNMGPAAFCPLAKHGFVYARLVPARPIPDAWLVSGTMRAYWMAVTLPLATTTAACGSGTCRTWCPALRGSRAAPDPRRVGRIPS